MIYTTDPDDPRLKYGPDEEPGPQNDTYLILPEDQRKKAFAAPLRYSYRHVGLPATKFPLRDLTPEEEERHKGYGYVKYEAYPESESPLVGRFWTQAQLSRIETGCNVVTTMSKPLAETWAADPHFYGATYCTGCQRHYPVAEFIWETDGVRLGE